MSYDESDPVSIELYGRRLIGKTFFDKAGVELKVIPYKINKDGELIDR